MADAGSAVSWREGGHYSVKSIVRYDGKNFRCLQSHTAQASWNPKDAVTLWIPNVSGQDPLDVPYGAEEEGKDQTQDAGQPDQPEAPQPGTEQPTEGDIGGEVSAPNAEPTPPTSHGGSAGEWAVGAIYSVGDICTYGGQSYQCRQAHTVHAANWTPPNTLDLWLPVAGQASPPPWAQGGKYNVGDRCSYEGKVYSCRQAHTAFAANWTPPNTLDLWLPEN